MNKRIIFQTLRMVLCCLVAAIASRPVLTFAEVLLYISPTGNDAWSGTLSAPNSGKGDGPLATLEGARKVVRERIAEGLKEPVTVNIRGGEYALDQTVVFGPEDSGTAECPVTYRAYENEKPVFTGGIKLSNWKKATANPEGVHQKAKGNLWYCDIPAELKGKWQITTLYDGLTLLPRCSSGELKLAGVKMPEDYNCQPKEYMKKLKPDDAPVTFSREFHFKGNDVPSSKTPGDIEIFIRPTHKWLINMLPLAQIDADKKTALLAIDPTYHFDSDNAYKVENAIEYLDEAGEWIFSSSEGRVYLWPKRPIEESDIRAPFLQEFIRVEGIEDQTPVRFLNFTGLHFRHGLRDTWKEGDKGLQHDWEMYDKGNAVLRFRHAEDCEVRGSDFKSSSGGGVRLDLHCQRITVADNCFAYLGGPGIVLSGYAPGTKDENHHNTVSNNLIHHVGEIYWHSPGIFIAQSGHNLISHNTIHDLGYNGMVISGCRPHEMVLHKPLAKRREWVNSLRLDECLPFIEKAVQEGKALDIGMYEPLLHARENRIEYNDIYKVMLRLGDGNGVYFSAMGKNNRLEYNYVHDIDHSNGLIRLDDDTNFAVISNNAIVRGNRLFEIKGPCEIRNNIIIDLESYINIIRGGASTFAQNVFLDSNPNPKSPPYRAKKGMFYSGMTQCENNVLFSPIPPDGAKPGQELATPEQRGDSKVGLLYADPMIDRDAMKQKIFRFLPGSPALKLGIQPIDLSSVGSTLAP